MEIKRKIYTITDTNLICDAGNIVIENIVKAKLYDGSGDLFFTYLNDKNKTSKGTVELESEDEKVVIDLLKEIKNGEITTRKRNIFEATKAWLTFFLACLVILVVLYSLTIEGGSVRVPAIMIPILNFIMDFGIFKSGAIITILTVLGCTFSIVNRKTITEFKKAN